jgi:endonuclease YncB( thermonuclease family)
LRKGGFSVRSQKPSLLRKAPCAGAFGKQEALPSVSRVIDGDTIALDSGERVRLVQIDSPESKGNAPREGR